MHSNVIIFQALRYARKKSTATYPEHRDLDLVFFLQKTKLKHGNLRDHSESRQAEHIFVIRTTKDVYKLVPRCVEYYRVKLGKFAKMSPKWN